VYVACKPDTAADQQRTFNDARRQSLIVDRPTRRYRILYPRLLARSNSSIKSPRSMNYKLLLAASPFASSALYLTYRHYSLSRRVQCQTTQHLQDETLPVPMSVQHSPESYILHHECARRSVPSAFLGESPIPEILKLFLRHSLATFSKYPPAWGIWYMVKNEQDRRTFNSAYIRSLDFTPGDRVCGVYVVRSRDTARMVLALDAPNSYAGPRVEGMLVVEVEEEEGCTTFMNHTVMWRKKGEGSAGVLESAGGRWMHALMVRGLVENGVLQSVKELGVRKKGV